MQTQPPARTWISDEFKDALNRLHWTTRCPERTGSCIGGRSLDDGQSLPSGYVRNRRCHIRTANERSRRNTQVFGIDAINMDFIVWFRGSFNGFVGFSVPLSHRILAGCDIVLTPSRFEPCGLTQQFAIRYGPLSKPTDLRSRRLLFRHDSCCPCNGWSP